MGRVGAHAGVHAALQHIDARVLDLGLSAVRLDDTAAVRSVYRHGAGAEGGQQSARAQLLPESAGGSAVHDRAVACADELGTGGELTKWETAETGERR